MDRSLDHHEQYSGKTYLLIYGAKENKQEDTDEVVTEFFEKEVKEKLSANDIDRSHRSRPIRPIELVYYHQICQIQCP